MRDAGESGKRVVAKLDLDQYVQLYGLKLREGKTLETLLREAVALLIETRRRARETLQP
jgi:hypothetical protein